MNTLTTWRSRFASALYQESLVHRFLFNDRVEALRTRPLAMFFYNQRAIFLGAGLIFLLVMISISFLTLNSRELQFTIAVLVTAWLLDVAITLLLHPSFVRRINEWVASEVDAYEYQPLFDRYFRIDSSIVILLILSGKAWGLYLDAFVALLFANTIVYSSAYVRGGKGNKKQVLTILWLLGVITFFLLFGTQISAPEPRLFYLILNSSAIVCMSLMTLLSVLMISWLRTDEQQLADRRLGMLGAYQRMLSEGKRETDSRAWDTEPQYSERQFRIRIREVLKNLCGLGSPFWYRSACLWLRENHEDRGDVFLPAAAVNFDEASEYKDGLERPDSLMDSKELVLLHSLRLHSESGARGIPKFRSALRGPAAYVPLKRNGERIGVLVLYGDEQGPPLLYGEKTFLWGLASVLSNSMEQWEGRYRTPPLREMDELFGCESLDDVFSKAVKILKKYLEAGGCMVIFRPNPEKPQMEVRAVEGFSPSIMRHDIYLAGVGQTGRCAETGEVIKVDYVPDHRNEFDEQRLRSLEKAHKKPIISWMAIPIGPRDQNYGVIKVVNSLVRCSWFTEYDVQLGKNLARRLQVMIAKFLHIREIEENLKEIESAKEDTQRSANEALVAQQNAEALARQRQEDLMIITHQLQGPLSSLVGTITYLQTRPLSQEVASALEDLEALVEDSIAVCYGTFTTFALLDGKKISFVNEHINAPKELRKLCGRLQRTNSRPDLRFGYFEEESFPTLQMDRNVFTSVMYSLIHNAMKYADEGSRVILECSFEHSKAALKVKSEGQQIFQNETERIFQKFSRGQLSETGRRYSGVGLGLWVARELMVAVGGKLTVDISSNNPRFSIFIVEFPS